MEMDQLLAEFQAQIETLSQLISTFESLLYESSNSDSKLDDEFDETEYENQYYSTSDEYQSNCDDLQSIKSNESDSNEPLCQSIDDDWDDHSQNDYNEADYSENDDSENEYNDWIDH